MTAMERHIIRSQADLVEAARTRGGFRSEAQVANSLGIHPSRLSEIKSGILPADPYEIFRLAELARVAPVIAAAAARHARERNPAKRDYWRRIMENPDAAVADDGGRADRP